VHYPDTSPTDPSRVPQCGTTWLTAKEDGRRGQRSARGTSRAESCGSGTRAALLEAVKLKSDEFNAQGVELNQRYASTAVIPDPAAGDESWARDPKQYLQATTRPGAKLPHAWLVDEHGRRTSTLDVTGKGMFSLVTGLSGEAWAAAGRELDLPFLRTVVVGDPGSEDLYGYWADAREVEEAGAILVRPDGYVAWRVTEAVYDAAAPPRPASTGSMPPPVDRRSSGDGTGCGRGCGAAGETAAPGPGHRRRGTAVRG
jgi:2,4-dichlorophenol 6-monooxygenase